MFNKKTTNMNVKSLMLLLAIAGLGAGCSEDIENGGDSSATGTRSEIQIEMSGTSESQEYTKAIASESENQINDLKVYLFAAAQQDGPYYYLETWQEGTAYDPANPTTTNFKKQASGSSWKASIYPNELKGVPFIKLLCVANNGSSDVTDGKFYDADGTEIFNAAAPLTAVTTDNDGKITNAGAATTETAFKAAYRQMKNEADGTKDIILTPLLMTGDGQTKISGSVSKVNITLRRAMARFDIDNTTSKSNLTIETITLANARKNTSLWNATLSAVGDKAADLMTYAPVTFPAENTGANNGVKESAIYVYPGLATDESYLVIEGTYKSPVTTQQVPVTYNVPIQKTNGADAQYVDIKANSRYKLKITDVTQAAIYGTFEIEDWTSGGGINIKPDNDTPVFDPATGFAPDDAGSNADLPVAITNADGTTSTTEFKVVDNKSFKVTIAATGKVRAEKSAYTKTPTDGWLEISDPATEEKDGVWYTTFTLTSTNATGQQPIQVNFINEAASYDPALWKTLVFYGPLAAPVLTEAAAGHSLGNTMKTDVTPVTASMYKVNGSYITIQAKCIEGVKVKVPAGFAAAEQVGEIADYTATYKLKISDVAQLGGSSVTISVQNAEDETVKSDIEVTLEEPGMTSALGDGADTYATISGSAAAYTIKTDIDLLASGNYTFKINSPQGVTVELPSGKWLNVTESAAFDGTCTVYRVAKSSVDTYDDFDIVFINKLDASDKLTVTMNKAYSKPKLDAATSGDKSEFNGAPEIAADGYSATVNMYKANDSKVFIKMTCAEAATFANVSGLSVTDEGSGNYEIKVTDASQLTDATTELVASNSSDTERKAKLTITWKDPAITFEKTVDSANAASIEGDNINVTGTTFADNYGNLKITIKGYKGSTISVPDLSNTWAGTVGKTPAAIGEDGTAEITFSAATAGDATATADITITVTNGVTNGGDKTITLVKK